MKTLFALFALVVMSGGCVTPLGDGKCIVITEVLELSRRHIIYHTNVGISFTLTENKYHVGDTLVVVFNLKNGESK